MKPEGCVRQLRDGSVATMLCDGGEIIAAVLRNSRGERLDHWVYQAVPPVSRPNWYDGILRP